MTDEIECPDCLLPYFGGRELGGHAKTHKHVRDDRPECFTDDKEWGFALSTTRIENPKKMITRDFALAEACAICPLEFMRQMQSVGRCKPPAGAIPQRDLGLDQELIEEAV